MLTAWTKMAEQKPQPGRKVAALWDDGSGCKLMYVVSPTEVIDSEGSTTSGDVFGGFSVWSYLPDDYRFYCEDDDDDPVVFSFDEII